jgi:hypothetical protein
MEKKKHDLKCLIRELIIIEEVAWVNEVDESIVEDLRALREKATLILNTHDTH